MKRACACRLQCLNRSRVDIFYGFREEFAKRGDRYHGERHRAGEWAEGQPEREQQRHRKRIVCAQHIEDEAHHIVNARADDAAFGDIAGRQETERRSDNGCDGGGKQSHEDGDKHGVKDFLHRGTWFHIPDRGERVHFETTGHAVHTGNDGTRFDLKGEVAVRVRFGADGGHGALIRQFPADDDFGIRLEVIAFESEFFQCVGTIHAGHKTRPAG